MTLLRICTKLCNNKNNTAKTNMYIHICYTPPRACRDILQHLLAIVLALCKINAAQKRVNGFKWGQAGRIVKGPGDSFGCLINKINYR